MCCILHSRPTAGVPFTSFHSLTVPPPFLTHTWLVQMPGRMSYTEQVAGATNSLSNRRMHVAGWHAHHFLLYSHLLPHRPTSRG
jgi:hypothetical protein